MIITPEGFPLAYELLAGNVTDNRTLRLFLRQIERRYGKAERIWLMDRGIPTEATLEQMRASDPPVRYLVGTSKGRLSKLEAAPLEEPWRQLREGIDVKLLPQAGELYVLARSASRVAKERAIRRKQLRRLWLRLRQGMALTRDRLLLKLGAAWRLVQVTPQADGTLGIALNRAKAPPGAPARGPVPPPHEPHRPGPGDPLGAVHAAGPGGGGVQDAQGGPGPAADPPPDPPQIEAHIFVAFLAYALHATLRRHDSIMEAFLPIKGDSSLPICSTALSENKLHTDLSTCVDKSFSSFKSIGYYNILVARGPWGRCLRFTARRRRDNIDNIGCTTIF